MPRMDSRQQFTIYKTDKTSEPLSKSKKLPLLSPLRYPGSKRRLFKHIELALKANGIFPDLYVEPFAGGASVALQLLQNNSVNRIGLIDKDPLVTSFWYTAFFDSQWLIDQISKIEVNLENWKRFRLMRATSTRGMALTCLFLNRTSFSGILAPSAGPIGGTNQSSEYLIDCRFARETLIKRITQISKHRSRIAFIWNSTWQESLAQIRILQAKQKLSNSIFYYLDPPFFEKADRLYRFYFSSNDHIQLRDYLLKMNDPWLLSYDAPTEAQKLYGDSIRHHQVSTLYSAAADSGFRIANEILISNLHTILPQKANENSYTDRRVIKAKSAQPNINILNEVKI